MVGRKALPEDERKRRRKESNKKYAQKAEVKEKKRKQAAKKLKKIMADPILKQEYYAKKKKQRDARDAKLGKEKRATPKKTEPPSKPKRITKKFIEKEKAKNMKEVEKDRQEFIRRHSKPSEKVKKSY